MSSWLLFVDESGDFSSNEDLVVGGVLVQSYRLRSLSRALRSALEARAPGTPYPMHAAHDNIPTSLLWGCTRGAPLSVMGPSFPASGARAVEIARTSDAPEARAFREAVVASATLNKISIPILREFDAWLSKQERTIHQALRAETDRRARALALFLRDDFTRVMEAHNAVVIGAWHAGDPSAAVGRAAADDKYALLYETLLERALAHVAPMKGACSLWPLVGKRGWARDEDARLDACRRAALAHPLLRPAQQQPTLLASFHHYNDSVPAGIVLADFVVNRMRRIFRGQKPWVDVERSVASRIGLPISAPCDLVHSQASLPTVGTTGADRAAIRVAATHEPPPPLSGPCWAIDQAKQWIEAIHG